jgi:outer membrane protein OmpA-like peptidoglycan-associated protein
VVQTNTVVETVTNRVRIPETLVTFRQGRTNIDPSQLPNVERVATYMSNHGEATVVIKGYASPEGSIDLNIRIAHQRAEAVRQLLVNRYRIAPERITAEGQGVGDMFSEPDWNRVSICTLIDITDDNHPQPKNETKK